MDLFGPFLAKGLGGFGRKQFKVWGVLYSCLSMKAVAIWAAPGYDTASFNLCHAQQVATYGMPSLVISDQGTQLKKAASEGIDWAQVAHGTAHQGTAWKFTPAGCPWRNGQCERGVQMVKRTLGQVLQGDAILNFAELQTLFVRVAALVNARPLSARIANEGEWLPIAPNDLLHGRATGLEARIKFNVDSEVPMADIPRKMQQIRQLEEAFWARWSQDGFPLMCPLKKWTQVERNLQVGDVTLLKYDRQLGGAKYRLCRVAQLKPDLHGVVRTVVVELRDRKRGVRERREDCRAGLVEMEVAVQRLVVILPAGETWKGGLESDEVAEPQRASVNTDVLND